MTLPLSIAIIEIVNRAEFFISIRMLTNFVYYESCFIGNTSLQFIENPLLILIESCQKQYVDDIKMDETILLTLYGTMIGIILLSYGLIIIIIVKKQNQIHESLACFAFISNENIHKILKECQESSIKNILENMDNNENELSNKDKDLGNIKYNNLKILTNDDKTNLQINSSNQIGRAHV